MRCRPKYYDKSRMMTVTASAPEGMMLSTASESARYVGWTLTQIPLLLQVAGNVWLSKFIFRTSTTRRHWRRSHPHKSARQTKYMPV